MAQRAEYIGVLSSKFFGIKSDGITDDAEAVRLDANTFPNVRIKFPMNTTTIISDKIENQQMILE